MTTVILHARYATSDFDGGDGPGHLFDQDARVGTVRAYRQALRHVRSAAKTNKGPDWKEVRSMLRPALARIARNYWRDFDYDDRDQSAQVKAEAVKLISPLKAAITALDERPPFVPRALNSEVALSTKPASELQDAYATAMAANRALLHACEVFVGRDHRKKGGAKRFQNACRELAALWEHLFGGKFPRNFKTARAADREIARGVKRTFVSPGAAFVYLTLHEIGNRWVTVSQVEEALKALKGGK